MKCNRVVKTRGKNITFLGYKKVTSAICGIAEIDGFQGAYRAKKEAVQQISGSCSKGDVKWDVFFFLNLLKICTT